MNTQDPQAMFAAWMSQFTGESTWQPWLKMVPEAEVNPIGALLKEVDARIDSAVMSQLQKAYIEQSCALWQDFMMSKIPAITDKRFAAPAWQASPLGAFNAASYLLNARFLSKMADAVEAPPKAKQKISFTVHQMIDAMSPANFLVSNPEAQAHIMESKGESITKGMANMLSDMQKGRISLSDESAFEVGRNLAVTPGQVVFENHLLQLIQYTPTTDTVYQRPLLLIPPCINKFYILDLQPENSLVAFAVDQGHTVFLVSWRNPDESMSQITWDDYIEHGAIAAIRTVQEITRQPQLNCFGFCVGGTIIATALAVLAKRGEKPAASLTLLTSFLDFSDAGVMEVFIDEEQVKRREDAIGDGGLLPGRELGNTFSSLRPNDLIWNYVQSNYLKGKEPPPFDLLYWNSDSTSLPGPMFCWYLRNAYLNNSLKEPNKLTVAGEKLDFGVIDAPAFIYGSREDHIVPWAAAFASNALINLDNPERNQFVLGASGHIAGVINPASKNKRSYWTNAARVSDPQEWLKTATEHSGSWWPEWSDFLALHAGKEGKARTKLGNAKHPPIESAPGRYVTVRAD
jgi:polyhydroxyalkanoate synthase